MNLIYTRTQPPKKPRIEEDLKTPERLQMELDACGASIERDIPKTTKIIKCMISGGTGEFCNTFNFYVDTIPESDPSIVHQSEWIIDMATNPESFFMHFTLLDDPRNDIYEQIRVDLKWVIQGAPYPGGAAYSADYMDSTRTNGYYATEIQIIPDYLEGVTYDTCQLSAPALNPEDEIVSATYTGSISFINVLPKVPVRYDDNNEEGSLVFTLPPEVQAGDKIILRVDNFMMDTPDSEEIEITDEHIQNSEVRIRGYRMGHIVVRNYLKSTDRGIGYLNIYEE